MSFHLTLTIRDPNKPEDLWVRASNYLNYKLLAGSPIHKQLEQFLSVEERRLLQPQCNPREVGEDYKPLNPAQFEELLQKIYGYLQSNRNQLPIFHWIQDPDDPERWSSGWEWQGEDGNRWYITGGIRERPEHKNLLFIHQSGQIRNSFSVQIEPAVSVKGTTFHIRTEDWFEHCRKDIEEAIAVCDRAIKMGEPVYWTMW
jgi:hypothetical protein